MKIKKCNDGSGVQKFWTKNHWMKIFNWNSQIKFGKMWKNEIKYNENSIMKIVT